MAIFAVSMGAFEASRGTSFERFVVEDAILAPTVAIINVLSPHEHVTLDGRTIVSPVSRLHVIRGCEGIEMFLMLIAAVAAFPAPWKRRLTGLAAGAILAYLLSIARLAALHFTLRYSPAAWEALHGLVLPLAPVILMGFFFMRWSAGASAAAPEPDAA
jgi:exosortase family protein XrtM